MVNTLLLNSTEGLAASTVTKEGVELNVPLLPVGLKSVHVVPDGATLESKYNTKLDVTGSDVSVS